MPIHDWARVDAGFFHHFHHRWISAITDVLFDILPGEYYALAERQSGRYEPDVLTLRSKARGPIGAGLARRPIDLGDAGRGEGVLLAEPKARVRAETDLEHYRRKQDLIAVRHVSGDELVAVIELVSRGNKSGQDAMDDFVTKSTHLLDRGIHLLIVDLQPPTKRDPEGIHGRIWDRLTGEDDFAPTDKPLTLAAYEAGLPLRAFVEPVAVGDAMPPMPLFLCRGGHVLLPLEETYASAWRVFPRQFRDAVSPS